VVLFAAAGFIESAFWGHVGAFTPLHLPHLGVAGADVATWTGLSATLATLPGLPFLPLWGALADRFARKPIVIRSFVAHVLAALVMFAAPSLFVFVLGRALMSFSMGNAGLMMTTLSEQTPRPRIGLAFALMNSAAPIGAFLGPLLGGPVIDRFGFGTLLVIDALALSALIAVLAVGYRDPVVQQVKEPLLKMAIESVLIIWRSPRLRALFPALFILFSGWMVAFAYLPLVVNAVSRGAGTGAAVGLVLGAGGLATLILSPLIGVLADRLGHWRVLLVAAAIEAALWPLPGLARSLVTLTVAWALLNAVASGVFAVSFSVLSESASREVRARVMAFAYLPVTVGSLIGPTIGSAITHGSPLAVFPAAALMTALGTMALWLAWRQARLSTPATRSGGP
jgi:MFS transporter, DHA1 family, multidrug resistance protein